MNEKNGWGRARKKPVEIRFRKPNAPKEEIATREGLLTAHPGEDYIIRGVQGEEYPIKKDIFSETYDVLEPVPEGER